MDSRTLPITTPELDVMSNVGSSLQHLQICIYTTLLVYQIDRTRPSSARVSQQHFWTFRTRQVMFRSARVEKHVAGSLNVCTKLLFPAN